MLKGWFVLQWSLDNLPLVPDGLWCVIDPNRRTHDPVTETNLNIARAGRAARQRKSVNPHTKKTNNDAPTTGSSLASSVATASRIWRRTPRRRAPCMDSTVSWVW
jgi:hypothetical protein